MDIALLVIAFLLMLIGIVGCIVPGLPGTPIAYGALWSAQATDKVDFSWQFLLVWGIVTIVISVLDYIVPAWGTKQFGGTKWGVWGSTIGVFVGLFFGPFGVIFGPLVGAILFELIPVVLNGRISDKALSAALRAGWGSFIGILFGTIIKLVACGLMTLALIQAIW